MLVAAAAAAKCFPPPPSVGCSQDGFIHLSADPGLLLTIANHFYTDSQGDWVVLVLDPARLTAEASAAGAVIELGAKGVARECNGASALMCTPNCNGDVSHTLQVKFEPAAPVGDKSSGGLLAGQQQQQQQEPLFPHLYGSINFEAVLDELPMRRSPDGCFLSIEGLA